MQKTAKRVNPHTRDTSGILLPQESNLGEIREFMDKPLRVDPTDFLQDTLRQKALDACKKLYPETAIRIRPMDAKDSPLAAIDEAVSTFTLYLDKTPPEQLVLVQLRPSTSVKDLLVPVVWAYKHPEELGTIVKKEIDRWWKSEHRTAQEDFLRTRHERISAAVERNRAKIITTGVLAGLTVSGVVFRSEIAVGLQRLDEEIARHQKQKALELERRQVGLLTDLRIALEAVRTAQDPESAKRFLSTIKGDHADALKARLKHPEAKERSAALDLLRDWGKAQLKNDLLFQFTQEKPVHYFNHAFLEYISQENEMNLRHQAADAIHAMAHPDGLKK